MHKILANTLFLGKDINYMTDCHSTNDIAAAMLKEKSAIEGTIVITDRQLKGKGQRGNTWYSEPGQNLTFSLVLKPTFITARRHFDLNIIVALALKDTLTDINHQIQVKWPNDIVHPAEGKLGGILIENTIAGANIESSIIGIGLNLNQTDFPFPGASSLALLAGKTFDQWELLETFIRYLEGNYMELKKIGNISLKQRYQQGLYRKDIWCKYEDEQGAFEGIIQGVDEDGRLIIEKKDLSINFYNIKEVKFIQD
ncbi:biotin--[acetyl-CoA-carboxylase] ligase [Echinicola pacifica]|uniref:biotin--[biotin carboxyl-carrier protein] ligase n=1 Tax=Echinicola pacifica TaxID=346377 RepID=A0A918PX96_9BACT|nr:biotin--[acetyl-CoA-carboxylase] ligase [Echinicola pacifica]GGZ26456.1 biotin--[acetyl-CoA-carboxylase] ligase [Echinicola pacifica]